MVEQLKIVNTEIKKWILPKPIDKEAISNCPIGHTLQKVLLRRGLDIENELAHFLKPPTLPIEDEHFRDINKATNRIIDACCKNEKIAICGDYDADGITSTVLLLELFIKLGADARAFIPSRQEDGYGLNERIINKIHSEGIKLAITVDNGISAFEAIRRSKELNIDLIITDHHKITKNDIGIFALIHPELTPLNSPYKYLAGVGIAYMIAINICKKLNYNIDNTSAKELFCIGTIADMAPLIGANRKWLKDNLPKFLSTNNKGLKSIIHKLKIKHKYIKTDDIGFKIAPLINAVGRIGDPKLIIDLLMTKSDKDAMKLVDKCIATNIERRLMTTSIEVEALLLADNYLNTKTKFLVISKREWHPGIIGIVASRLLDRFNLPTAILSEADNGLFRGSVRSNNLLKVNKALEECHGILISQGGHSAAGGFTIREERIIDLRKKLNDFANKEIKKDDLVKTIKPEAHITISDINISFYDQLMLIGPFGMFNPAPVFWARKCTIVDIIILKDKHTKLILSDGSGIIEAIKWNDNLSYKSNQIVDIAFYVELNEWKNVMKLQLNIIDIKKYSEVIKIFVHEREYKCMVNNEKYIEITNKKGDKVNSKSLTNLTTKMDKKTAFAKKILSFAEIALARSI